MLINRRQALKTAAVASFATCCGCKSAPMTGRRQLIVIPENEEISLGVQAFQETMADETPSSNQHFVKMVNQVGHRIAAVSGRTDYQWEFRTIASETQNAFCLPGGKVAIYEGILPVCQNEAGLAVVMAHEVAHAFARHGGERMSQRAAINFGQQITGAITKTKVPKQSDLLLRAYGVVTELGSLKYNRVQESEADHIGIMLMSKAGYDPGEAPEFWRRFASIKSADYTPEFLSTHPADERRATDLEKLIPQAAEIYAQAPQKFGRGGAIKI